MSNDPAHKPAVAPAEFIFLSLSSPSGAGKTTLCGKLREAFPLLRFSVSHTTRSPRPAEADGREYHFTTRPAFQELIEKDGLVEWAEVHGNFYGTSVAEIDRAKQGNHIGILFDVDCQGARQIRARFPEVVTVFVLPPSLEELERRLRTRASDDERTIIKRLAAALGEIEHYGLFDYVVVNDNLEEASRELISILTAERCRRHRRACLAESMLRAAQTTR